MLFNIESVEVPIIGLEDLIAVKMLTGRTQDKANVGALVKIMRNKKNN